jgi:predicted DCC family thiol-disulfide oxidoreductase YuxK
MNSGSTSPKAEQTDQWLLYDGDCPFCSNYVQMLQIKKNIGDLPLIDARNNGAELAQATAAGLDLDQGMVLKINGVFYHGPIAYTPCRCSAVRSARSAG